MRQGLRKTETIFSGNKKGIKFEKYSKEGYFSNFGSGNGSSGTYGMQYRKRQ